MLAGLAAAACESAPKRPPPPPQTGQTGVDRAVSRTQAGIGDAALSPLTDLNIRREEIPPRLVAIVSPYEPVKQRDCVSIGVEVLELTNILGPDSDAPPPGTTDAQRNGDAAADLALKQVSSTMSDFIPFRSLVRMATGASEHERQLRAAYEMGVQRRAYLKGMGASMGCAPPAAPQPGAGKVPQADIEYRGAVQRAPTPPVVTLPPTP